MDKKMYPDIIIMNRKDEKVTKIIDVKYKPKLYESDLYQIGFYIHEYGMESQEPLDEAFAILPRYSDEKNGEIRDNTKDDNYEAIRSEKTIRLRRINVHKLLELIRKGKKEDLEFDDINKLGGLGNLDDLK